MRSFRHIPIHRKLTVITMLTSGVALLVACVAFVAYEQVTFRFSMAADLSVLTDLYDDNVASGLIFDELKSIEQTLLSLNAKPHILAAAVYDKAGRPVAKYQRADLRGVFPLPAARDTGTQFERNRLDAFRRITLAGETIGTIFVTSDLKELSARSWRYGAIVTIVMILSALVALVLSAKLQRIISEPITNLAAAAARVVTQKDYSVRAVKYGDDELGALIDTFNEMLRQIQQRDLALQSASAELEVRVEERTGELATTVSLLNATLDSTADGILALQLSGRAACYNSKFAMLWGVPPDMLRRKDGEEIVQFAAAETTDPQQFTQRLIELRARPGGEAFDVIQLKDGRTVERYIHPQRIGGECVGMVINFRDITERKQAESMLEVAHKQLLDTSRQAGMAEVATSVLHNVGNVLNSVNVSATLVRDRLRRSKVANLGKAVALIQEHAADLGEFMTTDSKGKQLPAYLSLVAGHLASEQDAFIIEIDQLRKNIEHIKEVVSMQQSYAKVSGITETIKISELLEDTLRMSAESLSRHNVEVVREFEEVPSMTVDRHKTLQILVNLVRNAKHACQDSGRDIKRMIVRVALAGKHVRISVADNGVGVSPENLTRIFNHGFTTKKDGHGFGLHSGALAAREMGGSLSVWSDGPDKGAVFTLELPLERASQAA
ncbi:MAG: hypothetical protein QOF48_141 [Verrucomicrobiota bacterium]